MKPTRPPLKSLDDALAELLALAAPPLPGESISTFDADGRVLADTVLAPLDLPPFANSAVDGYAVAHP